MKKRELARLYASYLSNWVSSGGLINTARLPEMAVKVAFDKIITRKANKKVWCIQNVPIDNQYVIKELIRNEMYKKCPNVRTIINTWAKPYKINIANDKFTRGFKASVRQYQHYERMFNDLSDADKISGKRVKDTNGQYITIDEKFVESRRIRMESFKEIFDHVSAGGEFAHVHIFIEAVSPSRKDLKDFKDKLNILLKSIKINYSELYGSLGLYLKSYAPTGIYKSEKVPFVNAMLMSDKNLASIYPYAEQGVIGSGSGVYSGMIRDTNLPLMLNHCEGSTSSNNVVICKSGHGKTVLVINAGNSHIANKDAMNIMDFKGGEYSPLLNYADGVEIGMSETSGNFINTLRLDGLKDFSEDVRRSMYIQCVNATKQLMNLMVNLEPIEGNEGDLDNLFYQAVEKVYQKAQVDKNLLYTYENTATLHPFSLMEGVKSVIESKYIDDRLRSLGHLSYNRIGVYLSELGGKSAMFRKEISIADVLRKQVTIYNFGKNENPDDFTKEDNIRIHQMAFLNARKTAYMKAQGLFTVDVYEELQRAQSNPRIMRTINHRVTGGRSDNVITYLITNSPNIFSADNLDNYAIRSNINNYFIGFLEESDIDSLTKIFNVKQLVPMLKLISDDQKNYNRHFAVKYDTGVNRGTAMIKVEVPDHIMQSDLFKTRDTVEF